MTGRSAARLRLLLVSALAVGLAGCVTLPEGGQVRNAPTEAGTPEPGTFDYNPESPRAGDPPEVIVDGFLDALRESPLTLEVARQFLTEDAGKSWTPSRRTVVYDDGGLGTAVSGNQVAVSLSASVQLDSRGSWLGDPTGGKGLEFDLDLAREGGEWRIANPPDAVIVSRTHFDTRYVRYDLHYFDPSARVLVPEPVYLPSDRDTPSLLVSGLLAGPPEGLQSVERTFFPAGTRLELPVPVEGGVADVALSAEVLETDAAQLDLALAQLAWTLRQIPRIERMRVTVDGTPVDQSTGASSRSVLGWSTYDPAVPEANNDLYALVDGDVVVESEGEGTPITSAYEGTPVRSLAVSLDGNVDDRRIAAVTEGGRRALTTVARPSDTPRRPRQVYAGHDLLDPAYDVFGHLWLVDRTGSGARVVVIDGRSRVLPLRGLTGRDVSSFALSRDGTRLAAIVGRTLLLARISRSQNGRPTGLGPVRRIPLPVGTGARPVDLGWSAPDTLGVLVRLNPTVSQVLLASVDGAFALGSADALEALFARADRLVTWPGPEAPVYVLTPTGRLFVVSATGHWTAASVFDRPTTLAFPG